MKTFKIYTSGNMLKIDYSVDAVLVKTYTAFRGTSQLSAFATSKGSNVYLDNIHSADSVIGSAIDFDAVDVEFLNSSDVAYATITDLLADIDSLSGNFNSGGGSPQYSTTETVVGTWIDGKPIYRKVIYFSVEDPIALINIEHNLDIKQYIRHDVLLKSNALGNDLGNINQYSDSALFNIDTNNITIEYFFLSSYDTLILEYTKTTD
jgi:hypothetical protein